MRRSGVPGGGAGWSWRLVAETTTARGPFAPTEKAEDHPHMTNAPAPSWRTGVARRLQRLAGALADDAEDLDAPVAAPAAGHGVDVEVEPIDGETPAELAARRLRAVIEEL